MREQSKTNEHRYFYTSSTILVNKKVWEELHQKLNRSYEKIKELEEENEKLKKTKP